MAKNNGEAVIGQGGTEAFVPIVVDQDQRRRVLYVHASRSLGPLDAQTLLSIASGLHLGFSITGCSHAAWRKPIWGS